MVVLAVSSIHTVSAMALVARQALPHQAAGQRQGRPSTVMIISPEAMITVQKTFNRAKFDRTVETYMKVGPIGRGVIRNTRLCADETSESRGGRA